jgi:carboxyl-terminal processing protease
MPVKALKARFLRYFWIMRDAVKYLLNMKRLPIVIMMVIAGIFLAFQTLGTGTKTPPGKYEEILRLVGGNADASSFQPTENK